MLGAIIGDIVGSRFEFNNTTSKSFAFITKECDFTNDTICSIAIAEAYYGVPSSLEKIVYDVLPKDIQSVLSKIYKYNQSKRFVDVNPNITVKEENGHI